MRILDGIAVDAAERCVEAFGEVERDEFICEFFCEFICAGLERRVMESRDISIFL